MIHETPAGKGVVYPVVSRRSSGLSLGVNLFPQAKACNFDCPYCEVPPGISGPAFSLDALASELEAFFNKEYPSAWPSYSLKDICFSGNGEPTLSPYLFPALELCAQSRRSYPEIAGKSALVLITNATGFGDPWIRKGLGEFAEREGLSVWAKLDSGGQALYSAMNRSSLAFEEVLEGLRIFSRLVPVTIQTMVCSLNGRAPSSQDAIDLAVALSGLLDSGCRIHGLQVYTLARPPLEAWAGGISDADIKEYIGIVASVLGGRLPVQGYGASGLGPLTL